MRKIETLNSLHRSTVGEALSAFVQEVGSHPALADDPEPHIRFPQVEGGTLRGSAAGRALWDSSAGRALVAAFLSDPGLAGHFAPPPEFELLEIYGRVASFVTTARASGDATYISANTGKLLEELSRNPSAWGAWLVRWISTPVQQVAVNAGLFVLPAEADALSELAEGLFDHALVTVPRDIEGVLLAYGAAERREFGGSAAILTLTTPEITLMQLAMALWLQTGVKPVPVIRWARESAEYPMGREIRELAALGQRGAGMPDLSPEPADEDRLRATFYRISMNPWMDADAGFEEETAYALRAASNLVDNALGTADGAIAAMNCFSAADGLLNYRGDRSGIAIGRIAALVGSNVDSRRVVRRVLQALYDMRGEVAHGRRPAWKQVFRFLGRPDIELDSIDWTTWNQLQNDLHWRVVRILRSIYGCYLWLAIDLVDELEGGQRQVRAVPGVTKEAIVELTTKAHLDDPQARQRIDELIPRWLRDPLPT